MYEKTLKMKIFFLLKITICNTNNTAEKFTIALILGAEKFNFQHLLRNVILFDTLIVDHFPRIARTNDNIIETTAIHEK